MTSDEIYKSKKLFNKNSESIIKIKDTLKNFLICIENSIKNNLIKNLFDEDDIEDASLAFDTIH